MSSISWGNHTFSSVPTITRKHSPVLFPSLKDWGLLITPSSRETRWRTRSPSLKSVMGYFKGTKGGIFREIEKVYLLNFGLPGGLGGFTSLSCRQSSSLW